nr:MAG TPA: hypothetical protein [Caudoviricetes sp.]
MLYPTVIHSDEYLKNRIKFFRFSNVPLYGK